MSGVRDLIIESPDEITLELDAPDQITLVLEFVQQVIGGSGGGGANGTNGWSPILAVVSDGERRVLQVSDWVGGTGTKPATGQFLGATGLVATAALAADIRGPAGADGSGGVAGVSTFNGRDGDVVPQQADYDAFFLTPAEGDAAYAPLVHTHVSTDVTDFVEAAQDATGEMVTGNTEDGVSVTYNDAANKLDFENTDKGSTAVASHVAMADPHGQYKVAVLDEGTSLTTFAQSLNFTGAGVTASNTGGAVTVNIPGGGGGGGGYSLDQLATDVDALITSDPVDGDFDVVLRDGAAPEIVKVPSINVEVIAARGDRASVGNRISAIANVASPNGAPPVAGMYYDNSFHSIAAGTFPVSANRFQSVPYITSSRLRIDQLGVVVTTAGAGVLARCFIYNADPITFGPRELLFSGLLELDLSTTGYKAHSLDFTFDADRLYWLGVNATGTATIRGIPVAAAVNFGLVSEDGTTYKNAFSKTGFIATDPLPTPSPVLVSELVSPGISIPSIRMRAAAL